MDASKLELPPNVIDYINEERSPMPPIADPDQPLRLDSLRLVRLVSWLEQELDIQVEDQEFTAENFATARTLGRLIVPKLQRPSEAPNRLSAAAHPSL